MLYGAYADADVSQFIVEVEKNPEENTPILIVLLWS
jgi:hypothetical protein